MKSIFSIMAILAFLTLLPVTSLAEEPNMRLAVISDVHVKNTADSKLEHALMDLEMVSPGYDAIAVVGDMTEFGLLEEYQIFKKHFPKK